MDIVIFMIVAAAAGFVGGMKASRWANKQDKNGQPLRGWKCLANILKT